MSAPLVKTIEVPVPAMATAGTDETSFVARAPFDGTIQAVRFTADAAITGVASNNRFFRLINRGQNGAGNTTLAQLEMAGGVNAVAGDELTIPLVGTPTVVAGDIIAWFSDAQGTGIADPGGLLSIEFSRV